MKRIYQSPNFTTPEWQDVIVMSNNDEFGVTNIGGSDLGVKDDF